MSLLEAEDDVEVEDEVAFVVDEVFGPFFFVLRSETERINRIVTAIRNELEGSATPL